MVLAQIQIIRPLRDEPLDAVGDGDGVVPASVPFAATTARRWVLAASSAAATVPMARWTPIQCLYGMTLLAGACLMTSCADSKESTNGSFDMSEYRKMLERQKNEQAAL